ncbi:thiamine pyrophosphokinase [Grosmannia clavigera kw1407]|uniref:Thiamine pyrophosphokinase n=1 Tax=Grosmannia clavigera (strain kw1407 / UAMH 11150) TaxID=655863 RepID=F0XCB3_GROCL|nr:thiamine pyrophosphokinase [Grosmannia clavigera kw1407]EFX04578.1 thiamine pyrophosphokinase [Grosmannia clavigera kw1407]
MASHTEDAVFEWRPASLFRDGPLSEPYAVIVLNQPLRNLRSIKHVWARASYRVAADGGANRLHDSREAAGESFENLNVIIGDLDSLRDETRAYFTSLGSAVVHDPDQYSTDFGKAVKYIWAQHPQMHIIAIGGLGGRVDQGVSQLHHLFLFQDDGSSGKDGIDRRMYLLSSESITFLLPTGRHCIHVREESGPATADVFAKYVGILPMQGPSIISTKGLEWDVTDWNTQFGGLVSTSNHILPDTRTVEVETNRPVVFTVALKDT